MKTPRRAAPAATALSVRTGMLPTTAGGSSFTVALANEAAMQRLVVDVA